MGWVDEVLGVQIKRKKKRYGIISISMLIIFVMSVILTIYMEEQASKSDSLSITLLGTYSISIMIGFLAFYLRIMNSNHRLRRNIKKAMKEKGEIQNLEEDMLAATTFSGNNNTTYVGKTYVLQVWWKRMNASQIQIVNYREAQKVRVEDTMQSFIDKIYYLKFTDSNQRTIGSLEMIHKENVMNLLEIIESNLSNMPGKIQDTISSPINNVKLSNDLSKLKGPSSIVTIIFGSLWLVATAIIIIYNAQKIPLDIEYTGTVSAVAYRGEEYLYSYYIDYLVIPSGNTFREKVSHSTYLDSQFTTDTIEREEYYSPNKDKYVYIVEKGLTPQEVLDKKRQKGNIIPIVIAIIGCRIISFGVKKAIKEKKGEYKND